MRKVNGGAFCVLTLILSCALILGRAQGVDSYTYVDCIDSMPMKRCKLNANLECMIVGMNRYSTI